MYLTRLLARLSAAVVLVAASALTMSPNASADPMGGYFDYYRFCYEHNRASADHGITIYRGAVNWGSGVYCQAYVAPWEHIWTGGPYNNYYSWDTVCRMHGYKGMKSIRPNGSILICR